MPVAVSAVKCSYKWFKKNICSNIVILIIDKELVAYSKTVISLLACTYRRTCMAFSPVEGKMLLFASSMLRAYGCC